MEGRPRTMSNNERIEHLRFLVDNGCTPDEESTHWLLDQLEAAERDRDVERARFDWFFGPRGVNECWSVEQWRAAIDAARGGQNGE